MKYSSRQMWAFLDELVSLNAPVPPGFFRIALDTLIDQCNGIGSDDPSVKWLVAPTTFVFSWMEVAAVPHDIWWGPLYNDGSRERFEQSNDGFRDTLLTKASRSFGWVPLRFLREKLRDGRRAEAMAAHAILSSDGCFDIWKRNAEVEPGPERME